MTHTDLAMACLLVSVGWALIRTYRVPPPARRAAPGHNTKWLSPSSGCFEIISNWHPRFRSCG
jgi:hypothetical protein